LIIFTLASASIVVYIFKTLIAIFIRKKGGVIITQTIPLR